MAWEPNIVTLIDGTQVKSDSEEWRHECEARAVMNMPTRERRNLYIYKVAKARGDACAQQLRRKVIELWGSKSQSQPKVD